MKFLEMDNQLSLNFRKPEKLFPSQRRSIEPGDGSRRVLEGHQLG